MLALYATAFGFQIHADQFCSHCRWADRPHSPFITWIVLGRRTPRTRDEIPQKTCITVSDLLQQINCHLFIYLQIAVRSGMETFLLLALSSPSTGRNLPAFLELRYCS